MPALTDSNNFIIFSDPISAANHINDIWDDSETWWNSQQIVTIREGYGYRKISKWLNQSRIKTHTGKNWFSSLVISVLKRKHQRGAV